MGSYPSAEKLLVYSTAPVDRAGVVFVINISYSFLTLLESNESLSDTPKYITIDHSTSKKFLATLFSIPTFQETITKVVLDSLKLPFGTESKVKL